VYGSAETSCDGHVLAKMMYVGLSPPTSSPSDCTSAQPQNRLQIIGKAGKYNI
jgi:hypothetical protein